MRQTIFGLVAAMAVVAASAAPAMACGETPCGQTYIPAPIYWGCNTGCGGSSGPVSAGRFGTAGRGSTLDEGAIRR